MKEIKTFITFILFLASSLAIHAQNSILEKKISLNYSSATIEEVLKDVTQQTGVSFQ